MDEGATGLRPARLLACPTACTNSPKRWLISYLRKLEQLALPAAHNLYAGYARIAQGK